MSGLAEITPRSGFVQPFLQADWHSASRLSQTLIRTVGSQAMTNSNENWLQRVRYTAAEPTSWLSRARTLRQASEDLWISGNTHSRNPGSELGATVISDWTSPDFVPSETGGSTCDVCFMVIGFALENLAKGIIVCRDASVVFDS